MQQHLLTPHRIHWSAAPGLMKANLLLKTCLFIVTLLVFHTRVYSQNISGLEGKQLTRIDDVGSTLISLIGTGDLNGEIRSVTITKDSEKNLGIRIDYTGFEDDYLVARVLNSEKEPPKETREVALQLDSAQSPLELNLSLKEDLEEGTSFEAPFLEISLSKSKHSFGKKIFLYSLHKKWQATINPENLVINLTPEPIGSAGSLNPEREQVILPAKNQKFKPYKAVLQNKAVMTRQPVRNYQMVAAGTAINREAWEGTWVNTDKNTRGITKLIISDKAASIKMYGQCQPQDCYWGSQALSGGQGGKLEATYNQGFATSKVSLSIKENKLTLQEKRTYTDRRPAKNNTYHFEKSTPYTHTAMVKFLPLALNKEEQDKGAQGPSDHPISLWEELKTDVDFASPTDVTNIRMDIFEDKNPASGIYYYFPAAYHLGWNEDNGFALRILYGTATDSGAGNVRIASTLTPNISTGEIEIIKELLKAHLAKTGKKFVKLRPIPLKETPQVSFVSGLNSQYEVSEEKVSVLVTSSISDPMEVSWVTDSKTKQEMQVALLENVGIQGTMTLKLQSAEVPDQQIPVRITLADPRTLGRFDLEPKTWRGQNWKNETPYPVKLKRLHMLLIKKQGNTTVPIIYSWDLGDAEIPPLAQAAFDDSKVPGWLDNKNNAKSIWLEYAVMPCEQCNERVISSITGGTSGNDIKNVTFETFKILQTTGAAFLQIKIRSAQGDPGGDEIIEFPAIRITSDMEGKTTGPLYVPEGSAPDLEYLMTLVMPDGQVYRADKWAATSDVEVFLGMHNVEDTFSTLPPIGQPAPEGLETDIHAEGE